MSFLPGKAEGQGGSPLPRTVSLSASDLPGSDWDPRRPESQDQLVESQLPNPSPGRGRLLALSKSDSRA